MPEEPLNELGPPPERRSLLRGELLQRGCDSLDPASPSGLERAPTLARRLDDPRPAVVLMRDSPDEVRPLEPLHDPRHRRRADAFGLGQLAERHRPAEDEHRKRREPGSADPALRVLLAGAAEQMDRRRVKKIGELLHVVLDHRRQFSLDSLAIYM